MKLTNTMRDAFIHAAMSDVPQVNYIEQIEKAAMEKAIELLPAKARALWQDKTARHLLQINHVRVVTSDHYVNHAVHVPGPQWDTEHGNQIRNACKEIAAKYIAQAESRKELDSKLRAVAYGCQTRKALADALPEFEKYLPADDAAGNRQLPVVTGVVTAFMQAGWPKGTKQAKKAA